MSDTTIRLGPYFQGEVPEPVLFTFLKADGTRDPLTGSPVFTSKFEFRRWNTATPTELPATLADQIATPGDVSWAWGTTSMATPGDYEGELWVGNTVNKYRAQRFRWAVLPSVQVPTL